MEIRQFEDKQLSHYSYAIISKNEVALIDPARDPQPYLDFAKENNARIKMVFETHPHADFVSSHLEIHQKTGATIYVSELLGAEYPHHGLKDGEEVKLGSVTFKSLLTPGHSPDSISILLKDESEKPVAVFTGDTLFIGDCGRPDLREKAGSITAQRKELAKQMYHSLREKLMVLPDNVVVYPAHGAGSLCGKGLSSANHSTMGAEKASNWSLQKQSEEDFIETLLEGQPFIPKYFEFNVGMNKKGAPPFGESISKIEITNDPNFNPQTDTLIVDTRPKEEFNKGHLKNAINILNNNAFETWLGSVVKPMEPFYLMAQDESVLQSLIERAAKIGYEQQIKAGIAVGLGRETNAEFNAEKLREHAEDYTIVDVRNENETAKKPIFKNAVKIPLHQLRERAGEIPTTKPIVVHCAGGVRSVAGRSILKSALKSEQEVYDLGPAIRDFE